nr:DEAD/DEAH box helicase [Nanchangia anserum]
MRFFLDGLDFFPDDYQLDAMRALDRGHGVLVAAPTGAGKTLIAEYALTCAVDAGERAFYTTPIKALSNQKYRDLCARFSEDTVGLATGDVTINAHAPIVVMTTEVARNMLYRGDSRVSDLGIVVMDEVHYLADHFRGPVWEEVILHLPDYVRIVSLSATVSNAEEFGEWLREVRGDTDVIVSERRPVPLLQHMCVGGQIYPLFADGGSSKLNRALTSTISGSRPRPGHRRHRERRPIRRSSIVEIVGDLAEKQMLPAICFIFSRLGCDQTVSALLTSGLLLTTPAEAAQIGAHITHACADLDHATRKALRLAEFQAAAEAGIAAHHAGMIPLLKDLVEELFTAGLLKVVCATETLALGINMPAKTVVIPSLEKWNGRERVRLTPGQYTQLTGRAGRRSLDTVGHAVVCYQRDQPPEVVASLASKRSYALVSAFHPTYNMSVNLLMRMSVSEARSLMERSFAQFQADRAVVGKAAYAARLDRKIARAAESLTCSRGDFLAYVRLTQRLRDAEHARPNAAQRDEARDLITAARVGDVLAYRDDDGAQRTGLVVAQSEDDGLFRLDVLTRKAGVLTLSARNAPMSVLGHLDLAGLRATRPRDRQRLASQLRRAEREWGWSPSPFAPTVEQLREDVRTHPCHRCPDRKAHQAKARTYIRRMRKREGVDRDIARQTSSIGTTFERVREVLTVLGYLTEDGTLTDAGRLLALIHTEYDLLLSEVIRAGALTKLGAADLAGALSACIYVPRSETTGESIQATRHRSALHRALGAIEDAKARIGAVESEAQAPRTGQPDPAMARAVTRWASGAGLEDILDQVEGLTPGDFVRHIKQVIDLLRQLRLAAPDMATSATAAISALRRGVVAWGDPR